MKRALLLSLFLFTLGVQKVHATESNARSVIFVGVDISASYMNTSRFDKSLKFLSYYLYGHLNGQGGLDKPHALFVGSIGGAKVNEFKTFFPIQTFEGKSPEQIEKKLHQIFPKTVKNPFTDYNAFFSQVAHFVETKKLVMRPISILMMSDGIPDAPGTDKASLYRSIKLKPLENLTRNLTIRLLYTDPVVAADWQTKIPRKRVKIWTQDAAVMNTWQASHIFQESKPLEKQPKFFAWVKDNVDFNVRVKRVD